MVGAIDGKRYDNLTKPINEAAAGFKRSKREKEF
jgi:hypothetical protein